jgi:hypothetical protein
LGSSISSRLSSGALIPSNSASPASPKHVNQDCPVWSEACRGGDGTERGVGQGRRKKGVKPFYPVAVQRGRVQRLASPRVWGRIRWDAV